MDEIPNDGFLRCFGFLNDEFLIATRPDVIKEILATNAYNWVKPQKNIALLAMSIGHGLITVEGADHKKQRRVLQPAFHIKNIQELYPIFWNKTTLLLDCIAKQRDGSNCLEVQDIMARTAIDMVGLAGFGVEFGGIEDPQAPMVRKYRSMFEGEPSVLPDLLCRILPSKVMMNLPVDDLREIKMSRGALEDAIGAHIRGQREKMSKGELKAKDILSVAMQSGSLTNEELVNQAMTFTAAGSDTTAFTLTCIIFELCRNHELQNRLRDEIRAKISSPDSGMPVSAADIDSLSWVTAVLNESLRFYPPVEVSARVSVPKTTVVCGHSIPRETMIDIPILAINRNKAFWEGTPYNSREFHAERWLDSSTGKINQTGGAIDPYAFMTFFRGVRGCIGEKFARVEMQNILAGVVGRYRMTFAGTGGGRKGTNELDIMYGFTGKILGGLNVEFKEVEGW